MVGEKEQYLQEVLFIKLANVVTGLGKIMDQL
jgi:hypothetical protein